MLGHRARIRVRSRNIRRCRARSHELQIIKLVVQDLTPSKVGFWFICPKCESMHVIFTIMDVCVCKECGWSGPDEHLKSVGKIRAKP